MLRDVKFRAKKLTARRTRPPTAFMLLINISYLLCKIKHAWIYGHYILELLVNVLHYLEIIPQSEMLNTAQSIVN